MPWCPECRTEYDAGVTVCADCEAALVETLPPETAGGEPVVVLHARPAPEARIAAATLEAEGIPTYLRLPDDVPLRALDVFENEGRELDVLVPANLVDRAVAVLNAPPFTEEELTAIEEAESKGVSE